MITRRVRALSNFHFRTFETDKDFVEGEVADVVFRSEKRFLNFIVKGLFQEESIDVPIGVPDIPVLFPPLLNEGELFEPPFTQEEKSVELEQEDEEERIGMPLSANLDLDESKVSNERNLYGLGWKGSPIREEKGEIEKKIG